MQVDTWVDLSDPVSYLGLHAFRQALSGFSTKQAVVTNVLPYFSTPRSVDRRTLTEIGMKRGIIFRWDEVIEADTTSAQLLISYARQVDEAEGQAAGADTLQLKVTEALQRAHFEMGLNLADPDVLVGVGQDFSIPAERTLEALSDVALADEIENSFALALHLGITKVPTFLFDEQVVVEGAHTRAEFSKILDAAMDTVVVVTADDEAAMIAALKA